MPTKKQSPHRSPLTQSLSMQRLTSVTIAAGASASYKECDAITRRRQYECICCLAATLVIVHVCQRACRLARVGDPLPMTSRAGLVF